MQLAQLEESTFSCAEVDIAAISDFFGTCAHPELYIAWQVSLRVLLILFVMNLQSMPIHVR